MDSNDSANTNSTTDHTQQNATDNQKVKPAVSVTTGGLGKDWESGKKTGFFKKVNLSSHGFSPYSLSKWH